MPSRIRIILKHNGGAILIGRRAVYQLYMNLPFGRAVEIRKAFPTRLGRLQAIMKEMPPEWSLTLIRERRGQNKNKSLYWSMKRAGGARDVPQAAQAQVAAQVLRPRVVEGVAPQQGYGVQRIRRVQPVD